MGTELYRRGVFLNRCYEELNLGNKELVKSVHRAYRDAGADVLSTNSWGAGFYKLRSFGLHDSTYDINFEAARLAREVAGDDLLVAGTVGPLGQLVEPWGSLSGAEAFEAFALQIRGLVEGGADFILLETFTQLEEALNAIRAAQSIDRELDIVASLAADENGELPFGPSLETAIQEVMEAGATIAGLNCHIGPQQMFNILRKLPGEQASSMLVQPNAGLPKEVDGRTIYLSTPEYFATFTRRFLDGGVRYIGGCCGTTPEHIRAMAQAQRHFRALGGRSGAAEEAVGAGKVESVAGKSEPGVKPVPFAEKSKWSEKLAMGEKVFTIELLPPTGISAEAFLDKVASIKAAGIDAINIPDGPRASSRMSTIVPAILVRQRVGIEPILHYTCRDRNLIGMQADFMGMHAIGLRNVLIVTGDPPKLGDYPNATGVFDVDSIGLTKMASRLNEGIDLGGKAIGAPLALSLGVGLNPVAFDFDKEMDRFERKVEAGAEWAITQPVFDLGKMEKTLSALRHRNIGIPVIMGIWPLSSLRNAQFMANEVPGVEIPDETMRRMAAAASVAEAREVGVAIAHEMYERIIDDVQGVQLSAPFGRIDLALRVIGRS